MNPLLPLGMRIKNSTARRIGAIALGFTLATTAVACGEESSGTENGSGSAEKKSEENVGNLADAITVEEPWVRATKGAKDTSMTAAFMVLNNTGSADARLMGASTEIAGMTELHEMVMQDGKSVMQKLEGGLEIRAGSGQLLQTGGNHVMLMDVTETLAAGDEVEIVLEFSDGSTKSVTAPVKAFTEEEGHYHAPGTGEHSH